MGYARFPRPPDRAHLEYINPPYAVEAGTRHDRVAPDGVRDVYPDFRIDAER